MLLVKRSNSLLSTSITGKFLSLARVKICLNLSSTSTPLLVILDGVTDPRNLGAVIRSAAGFYANAVVVAERRSAGVTGAVWKTAAGALSHVPVCQVVNITRTITDLQEKGLFAVALDGDGDMNLDQVDPDLANRPLILVIGAVLILCGVALVLKVVEFLDWWPKHVT